MYIHTYIHIDIAVCIYILPLKKTTGVVDINNNVDSKRHIIIRTAILYNEINSGQIMKKTQSNNM